MEGASAPSVAGLKKGTPEYKEAHAAYMRDYYRRNPHKNRANVKRWQNENKDRVELYKKEHPCVRCGENDYRCLTFHHLRDKKHNVSAMPSSGFRWETILKEINKCEVLCANCHAREHYRQPNELKCKK